MRREVGLRIEEGQIEDRWQEEGWREDFKKTWGQREGKGGREAVRRRRGHVQTALGLSRLIKMMIRLV